MAARERLQVRVFQIVRELCLHVVLKPVEQLALRVHAQHAHRGREQHMVHGQTRQLVVVALEQAVFAVPAEQVVKRGEQLGVARRVRVACDGVGAVNVVIQDVRHEGGALGQRQQLHGCAQILVPDARRVAHAGIQKQAAPPDAAPGRGHCLHQLGRVGKRKGAVGRQGIHKLLDHDAVCFQRRAEANDVAAEAGDGVGQYAEHVGGNVVVTVDEDQILALRGLDADVARLAHAAVRLVDGADALRVRRSIAVADRAALAVGRAVVDEDDLVVFKILRQHGVDALGQVVLDVVDRDDNTENHARFSSPSGSASGFSLRICVR